MALLKELFSNPIGTGASSFRWFLEILVDVEYVHLLKFNANIESTSVGILY